MTRISYKVSRRQLLAAAGSAAAVACSTPPATAPGFPDGRDLYTPLAARAHALRGPPPSPNSPDEAVDIAIVGGGIAGVSAAWRLRGAGLSVQVLELADQPGGTAAAGSGPHGPYPLGAHYITLPSPEARALRALLAELGVITAFDPDGRPRYRATDLCFAPQERLFIQGMWVEDLWPAQGASDEDLAQRAAWSALVARYTQLRGADDKPAFCIPVAHSSHDPAIRALSERSFADWLDEQGLSSPRLRWLLEYGTRDDYGTTLAETSAWAGLHYHCARRPDPAETLGTAVLTWPGGNGWLVERLVERLEQPPRCGALVHRVTPSEDGATLLVSEGEAVTQLNARWVILAVPAHVADRLVERPPGPRPELAPWRVVSMHCDRAPFSYGVPVAWDSVLYQGEGLGYVSSAHQSASYGGPTTLTWYQPLSGRDPVEARRELLAGSWEDSARLALAALERGHPDLRERVQSVDVMHWGHGTTRPVPGLHTDPLNGPLAQAAAALPFVSFAHSDLSGMSLFEESQWHGVRAAEEALAGLGLPLGESLL